MVLNLLDSLRSLGLEKSLVLSIVQQLHDHGRSEICLPDTQLPEPLLSGRDCPLGNGFLIRVLESAPPRNGYTTIEVVDAS